jgi:hypothetical protein
MIFRVFDELISTLPAVFSTQLTPTEISKLLAQESARGTKADGRVVGRIDGRNVSFRRQRRFAINPFAPVFEGSVRKASNETQLVGEFRYRKLVLLFCGLSYFVLLPGIPIGLAAIPIAAIWWGAPIAWGVWAGAFFALALVGVLFAEAAVIRLGMRAAKLDANFIAEHIENVFRRGANQ